MEYYSAMKRNGLLIHAITWMNLEIIMLSERSQTKKVYLLYATYKLLKKCNDREQISEDGVGKEGF